MKKIIENFKPSGGKHCITTALKQIFDYYNYPITEEMLFGLGSGLAFVYINLSSSPMVSGRIKPFVFEEKISRRLDIDISCRSSVKYVNAFKKTKKLIDDDKPVLIYADMPYLDYLNLGEDNHFGGHAVVLFGYDDKNEKFYISDRDNSDYPIRTPMGDIAKDYHLVDYDKIELARSSTHRPFPAKNKYLDITIKDKPNITKTIIFEAINETCNTMINAPAKLLGLNGIDKFAKQILKWSKFDDERLRVAGITNYFQIKADGGSGGGIFRRMYGDFLIEASEIVGSNSMKAIGENFLDLFEDWDKVGDYMYLLYETADRNLLLKMSGLIKELYVREGELLRKLQEAINQ